MDDMNDLDNDPVYQNLLKKNPHLEPGMVATIYKSMTGHTITPHTPSTPQSADPYQNTANVLTGQPPLAKPGMSEGGEVAKFKSLRKLMKG